VALNVKIRLSGMSRVEYWELSSASANTVAAILISTLSMAIEIFSETLDNVGHPKAEDLQTG
jgi:hypothetical protein